MSRKSDNFTTPQNLKTNKSIPEMTWEEILALPTENISDKKINAFRKSEAAKRKK